MPKILLVGFSWILNTVKSSRFFDISKKKEPLPAEEFFLQ